MMDYYGMELLDSLMAYYTPRYQLALERGYEKTESNYHWLYDELEHRVRFLRQMMLFLHALPQFMRDCEGEKALQYAVNYVSGFFSDKCVGHVTRSENEEHPYFNDRNHYYQQFVESINNFDRDYDLKNPPLLYVDLCEYAVRGVRLYLYIREHQFKAIDRGKFEELMRLKLPNSA